MKKGWGNIHKDKQGRRIRKAAMQERLGEARQRAAKNKRTRPMTERAKRQAEARSEKERQPRLGGSRKRQRPQPQQPQPQQPAAAGGSAPRAKTAEQEGVARALGEQSARATADRARWQTAVDAASLAKRESELAAQRAARWAEVAQGEAQQLAATQAEYSELRTTINVFKQNFKRRHGRSPRDADLQGEFFEAAKRRRVLEDSNPGLRANAGPPLPIPHA